MSIAIVRQAMPPIDATGMLLLACIWCVVLAGAIAIVKRGRLPLQFDDKAMAIPSVGERPDNISSYPARASEIIAQIGADIHDGPMQTLNALALMIATQGNDKTSDDHAAQLALSARIAEELRMISQGLVAPDVPSGPVHAILSAAIRHHESDTGQPVAFSLRGLDGDLTATRSHALYRIIREALQNAYRHGDATPAHVWAVGSGKRCRVTVSNSGAYKPDTGGGHLGHKTMEMRAQALGGTLRVISGIRTGTRLRVTFDA
ncbi:MAG: hypothetical protein KKB02_12025 [Alphaproteobacteria bacterium]|nr:hypothetical protein [Alphaproteobacteria bacterium]